MQIDYVLVASGNITLQSMTVALHASDETGARIEAGRHVPALHSAGYSQFTLYDTRRLNGELDKRVATFRLAYQEPQVIME